MSMTIYKLARLAGVSPSTVSRVLSGRDRTFYSAETARKVKELAAKHDFAPDRTAQALSKRETRRLQILSESWDTLFLSEYMMRLFQGMTSQAGEEGYVALLTLLSEKDWRTPAGLKRAFTPGLADGHITFSTLPLEPPTTQPVVMIGRRPRKMAGKLPSVDSDNVQGGRMATEHLIARGRRRILHLEGTAGSASAEDRREGYREAMKESGLKPETVACGYEVERARRVTSALLAENRVGDAIFAANDLVALGALQALAAAGRRVPDDVAVVGFDGLRAVRLHAPRLTTVRQPIEEIGRTALRLLAGWIRTKRCAARHHLLDVTLEMGETS